MLPVVLGGIGLATVVYGVREYCKNTASECEKDIAYKMETLMERLSQTEKKARPEKALTAVYAVRERATAFYQRGVEALEERYRHSLPTDVKLGRFYGLQADDTLLPFLEQYLRLTETVMQKLKTEFWAEQEETWSRPEQAVSYLALLHKLLETKLTRKDGGVPKKLPEELAQIEEEIMRKQQKKG